MPYGKAPVGDGLSAEIFKENKDILLPQLHTLLHQMRDALYNHKRDDSDCDSLRRISLLSVAGKFFTRVLKRLQRFAIASYQRHGLDFGLLDMVFTLPATGKCREQRKPPFITFVDLTKAFDTVSRKSIYNVLERIGCPPILLQLIISFLRGRALNSMEIHPSLQGEEWN